MPEIIGAQMRVGQVFNFCRCTSPDIARQNKLFFPGYVLSSGGKLTIGKGACSAFTKGVIVDRIKNPGRFKFFDTASTAVDPGAPFDQHRFKASFLQNERRKETGRSAADHQRPGGPGLPRYRKRRVNKRLSPLKFIGEDTDTDQPVDIMLFPRIKAFTLDLP